MNLVNTPHTTDSIYDDDDIVTLSPSLVPCESMLNTGNNTTIIM